MPLFIAYVTLRSPNKYKNGQKYQFFGNHGNQKWFFQIFICYPDSPWYYGHYGVLHNLLCCFYFPRCYAWMHKNNKFPFYNGCHGNQNTFLGNLFFDYVSTCIDGHFGVLSCFYYHCCYAKCIKTTNFHFITVAMATKIRVFIFFLLIKL